MEKLLQGDVYRNLFWLSHRGKVILFNCKRGPGVNKGEKSELTFCCVSFEREDSKFMKASDGVAVMEGRNTGNFVCIVKCKCVLNVQKRVTTPCVLVTKKSEKEESFQYSLLTLSDRLEPCFEFKLPYQMKENVSLLHGPTVMWSHAGSVFYTSPQAGEVRQIPIQLSHSVFGEFPSLNERLFILGQQNNSEKFPNNPPTRQTLGYVVESGHVFDGNMILPHPYICITQCILMLSSDKEENMLTSALVAATSNKQLVYFENGTVKETCQLPYEQPENIQVVNTGRNGCLFVVSFLQGHVCAIWRDTFQIASHWSGVSSVLVDDFVGCGTDQMLLVFVNQGISGQLLENFLLTDLSGITYANCPENRALRTSPPQENYLLTLRALESRLQSGLTVLQELQREERVKERVLQQSLRALAGVVSEGEPVVTSPEQEGLVALWDCDDESKDEGSDDKKQDMPAVSSKPQVDKLWHRIAEERMVVGVILATDSSVPVTDVTLSILTETSQSSTPVVIQTQSQVFCLPAPCSSSSSPSLSAPVFSEPAAKRSRQHSASRPNDLNTCRLAVTASTVLTPLVNSGCVNCHVLLHYVQRQDASVLMSDHTQAVLQCGHVSLDIHNELQTRLLRNPELKTDEVLEDFLSLMAVLDRWVLHIDSPDYSLGDIDGWIQKREGCKRIEVHPQYLLINSAGTSAPMLLHWHQITRFQGELFVHSRQLQMLQFLDSLLAHLPTSSSIRPIKGTTGQEAAQIFSLALEKEVVAVRECVSSLLCDEEGEKEERKSFGEEESPDPGSGRGLRKVREMWQRDVERSKMRLSPLVDVGRYRSQTQNMLKVQLDADLAALLDTQRTLFN
ncbi:Fanconi anemia group B protein [Notolabrus celidotus]|uniref:Fanconi anemia group B protein n=1 Tax=Notolabrus celidotus TaxID=1203425 RepID=UPI0014908A4B|nr:Fanconi anemia group B protein [Notolabrus celidotus]